LAGSLRVLLLALALALALALMEGSLIAVHPSLVGSVGIVAAVALRVGSVVVSIVVTLLTVLKAALLGRAKAVLTAGRTKVLVLVILLAVALLLLAIAVALLRRVALAVALLRRIAATLLVATVATAATVGIVRPGHDVRNERGVYVGVCACRICGWFR